MNKMGKAEGEDFYLLNDIGSIETNLFVAFLVIHQLDVES